MARQGYKDLDLKLSIVTPVFRPDIDELNLCIASLNAQTTQNFEWVAIDDGSPSMTHLSILNALSTEFQVQVFQNSKNVGIAATTQRCIDESSGEFVAFLDQDDMLQVNAVEAVIEAITEHPTCDVIYSDEDKILEGNIFGQRFWKPDWSPERFRHQNYFNHLTVIRKSLIQSVGGLRPEYDGSQDYDLLLRVTEQARTIVHIPEVLYHWRATSTSVASDPAAKPEAHDAAVRAVQDHLDRCQISGTPYLMDNFYVGIKRESADLPSVSIVIPTCGTEKILRLERTSLIENCIESILEKTNYPNFEIVVVADSDSEASSTNYLEHHPDPRVRVIEYDGEFNFSRKINTGALASNSEIIIALNDDTEVIESTWIYDLVQFFTEDDVGLVAPTLLLEDGRIQSAGHYFQDGVHHVAQGMLKTDSGPFGILTFPAERSGVTFAAAAMPRQLFLEVGGLSETFPISFNDVDFGNKIRMHGYRIIATSLQSLHHFESISRDPTVTPEELNQLFRIWEHQLRSADPYLPQWWRQVLSPD